MASANQRQTIDKRVNTSEGHYVKWQISICKLDLLRTWHFVKKYRTFCKTSPTSWDFRMSFPEVREDGTATLTVTAKRIDDINAELEVGVFVDVTDGKESAVYPRQTFVKDEMLPGSELEQTVELEPYPGMEGEIYKPLIVVVTILVSSCHVNE